MNLAVSTASEPARAAAWIEGFLRDSGELLYHDDALFGIFDRWLAVCAPRSFRSFCRCSAGPFGTFDAPLRRNLGEKPRGPRRRVRARPFRSAGRLR